MPLAYTRSLIETQAWRSKHGLAGVRVTSPLNWTGMRSKRPLVSIRIGVRLLIVMGVLTLGAIGCQGDPIEPDLNPDFMVGDWLAESLAMTSVANPDLTVELDTLGAVFTLSVQPSGRYTAILEGFGQSSSESGKLTVDGAYVVLMPEAPQGRSPEPCGSE